MSKDLHFELTEEYVIKRQKRTLKEQKEYEQRERTTKRNNRDNNKV